MAMKFRMKDIRLAFGAIINEFSTDGTMAGNSDLAVPTEKAVKAYTDAIATGLAWKTSVRVATTTNGALATAFDADSVVDGITLVAADRILIKDQSTGAENGIYVVQAAGAPVRATDADTAAEMLRAAVYVEAGTANGDTQWVCNTPSPITIDVTALTFIEFSRSGYTAGTGLDISDDNEFSIDSTVATLIGTQTFTNKTLTSPKINENVALTSTATELNQLDGVNPLKQMITVPVSFETAGVGTFKYYFNHKVTIDKILSVVTKALAGTDAGTITASSSGGAMANGAVTVAMSSAVGDEDTATPTTNNVIAADSYIQLVVAKTTPGGEAQVTIQYTITP